MRIRRELISDARVAVQNQVETTDCGRTGTVGRGGQLRRRSAHVTDESVLGDVRPTHGQPHRQPRRHSDATPGLSGGVLRWHCAGRRLRPGITADGASSARPCSRGAHVDPAAAAAGYSGSERARAGLLPSLQRHRRWTQ